MYRFTSARECAKLTATLLHEEYLTLNIKGRDLLLSEFFKQQGIREGSPLADKYIFIARAIQFTVVTRRKGVWFEYNKPIEYAD